MFRWNSIISLSDTILRNMLEITKLIMYILNKYISSGGMRLSNFSKRNCLKGRETMGLYIKSTPA